MIDIGTHEVSHSLHLDRAARLARNDQVKQAYESGIPIAEIAERFGMSIAYVTKIGRRAGFGRNIMHRSKYGAIVEDYKAGLPVKEICTKHEVNRRTVWYACNKAGVEMRKALPKEFRMTDGEIIYKALMDAIGWCNWLKECYAHMPEDPEYARADEWVRRYEKLLKKRYGEDGSEHNI